MQDCIYCRTQFTPTNTRWHRNGCCSPRCLEAVKELLYGALMEMTSTELRDALLDSGLMDGDPEGERLARELIDAAVAAQN